MLNMTNCMRKANQNCSEYHLIPIRIATIKGRDNNKYWQGCGEIGTRVYCSWECKMAQPLWKKLRSFLKKLKLVLPYDPAILLLGTYPKEFEGGSRKDVYTPMFSAALFTMAKRRK